jgi:serine/threonine protein kinase/ABC-type glycerol-3-phosphate transport system substrate-binding protein
MEFRLLGPVEVREGHRLPPLGGPKQRTLLAYLILRANELVTVERLIDAIWADDPPDTARNTLQTYIKHLRKAVGPERIQRRASGYVLVADPDEVDVLRFERMVDDARRRTQRDPSGSVSVLRQAIALWRGPALDDLADQPSLGFDIARLEELRIAAREELIEADLTLGRHRELVPELETLTGRHPFRERLWGQLMVALYRSGRQGDALAAYNRARLVLTDQLGIDPSPELRRLQEQVLKQDPALELTGEPLRGYRLLAPIGRGAFGAVHRAFQPDLGREVAVKIISPRLANDPEYIRRFDAEAQLVSRLEHPYIVPLYDYWREPGGAYLVMRYLRGGSLQQVIREGPLEVDRAVRLLDQIATALHWAHRQGVVHRDVKPANILFDEEGNAYLSDFGIAKDLAAAETTTRRTTSSPLAFYVSPEEARGETPTHLADIYNLGLVVYECLTGRHAFAETPPDELSEKHAREPVPSVRSSRADLPAAIDGVIERATAKDPDTRFPDAPSLAAAFREACTQAARVQTRVEAVAPRNPYKGLRPFLEADMSDFFGRERATQEIQRRLEEDVAESRFLAVVGPSGSGKSSLVRAGLVPALRLGGLPGSDGWFFVELVPGARPFEELDAALVRIAVDPRPGLIERLEGEEGLFRIAEEILPDDDSELFLVIDQFEEVFTHVQDEDMRLSFLDAIVGATTDPRSRVRVVLTLRADFYDRPLQYKAFGELLARRTYAVTPLSVAELERAVAGPAETVGIAVDPRLVGEVVAEVADRPGALPLLQYALTELFEERRDSTLTLEAYHELGGVSGALARRAEDLYGRLNDTGKVAARQLFLRLVGLGEGGSEDTRKRVLRSDLASLEVDRASVEGAIDTFGARRLLSFDRDPETRGSTVEVAHEALLREWGRLREWIESAREDLRMHARLSAAAREWFEADGSSDYLLTGRRLEQVDETTRRSSIRLTEPERRFLDASLARREAEGAVERDRRAREARLERRAFTRLRSLVAVLAASTLVAASLTVVAVNRSREAERRRIEALLSGERETAGRLSAGAVASLDTDPELSLRLALHAVDVTATLGEPVPAATVEVLHWALQEAGVQYPVSDAPEAVVDGPLSTRGVYDLPLPELLELARPHARSMAREECEQYFGEGDCPPLPATFPPNLRSEPIRAEEPRTAGQPLAGTEVTIWLVYDPTWQADFEDDLERFAARTGIVVELIGQEHLEDQIEQSIEAGDPPDLALFPQPGGVVSYAREGLLMDLGAYLDVARLRSDQSPYLISLGTVAPDGSWPSDEGGTYGAFVDLSIKSLIWYPVAELRAAGYAIPRTWAELIALSDRMVADGRTPWCLGFASSGAHGWPGTDWIENLVLGGSGPHVYDQWTTFHEIGFDDHVVREAFERLGQVVFAPGYLHRGTDGAIETLFDDAQLPMVQEEPPGCWFHLSPTFGAKLLPEGSVGSTIDVFPFPTISERFQSAVLGGGSMVAAFADRPETREVVRFLLSPEHGVEWAGLSHGFLSSNQRFDPRNYPPFWRRQSRLLGNALAADTFRFDGSDLMPPQVGLYPFWNAMIEYLTKGPGSLDRILAGLDAAWPEDG